MTIRQFSRKIIEFYPLMLREFTRRGTDELLSGSITVPQMVALHFMEGQSWVTMKGIAQVMMIKRSSATVLVDRLIGQGLAVRKRDSKDRRVVSVAITSQGKRRLKKIIAHKRRVIEDLFGKLSQAERDQYLKIVMKIQAYLKAPHELPKIR